MGASSATALAALKIGGRVAFERLVRPKARDGKMCLVRQPRSRLNG